MCLPWLAVYRVCADVRSADEDAGCQERKCADELNTFKKYSRTISNEDVVCDSGLCPSSVHAWGAKNRVTVQHSRECFAALDPRHGFGELFLLLGPVIDNKLRMKLAVDKLYRKAKPKARALLRYAKCFGRINILCL